MAVNKMMSIYEPDCSVIQPLLRKEGEEREPLHGKGAVMNFYFHDFGVTA